MKLVALMGRSTKKFPGICIAQKPIKQIMSLIRVFEHWLILTLF